MFEFSHIGFCQTGLQKNKIGRKRGFGLERNVVFSLNDNLAVGQEFRQQLENLSAMINRTRIRIEIHEKNVWQSHLPFILFDSSVGRLPDPVAPVLIKSCWKVNWMSKLVCPPKIAVSTDDVTPAIASTSTFGRVADVWAFEKKMSRCRSIFQLDRAPKKSVT